MSHHTWTMATLALPVFLAGSTTYAAQIGAQAILSMNAHNVGGTVTVVDEDTFRVDDFTYDGGGPAVYFYLGTDESLAAFNSGLEASALLTGTVYDGTQGSLFFDLPAGETFAGYDAISVWCELASANFGSGTFALLDGDLNRDGFVGVDDLNVVLVNWNQNVTQGEAQSGDPTGDGFVGIDDLNIVLVNWNNGSPLSGIAVPEPASAAALGCLCVVMLRRL
jgi:Electron transfer DM13